MSQAHIEQFYGIASKDGALFNKMMAGAGDPDAFLDNAVKEAGARGFTFTKEEATAWIERQKQINADGELSDQQLEAVAGGKGDGGAALGRGLTAAGNAGPLSPTSLSALGNAFTSVGQNFTSFFSGW
jgi:hypothetical protein